MEAVNENLMICLFLPVQAQHRACSFQSVYMEVVWFYLAAYLPFSISACLFSPLYILILSKSLILVVGKSFPGHYKNHACAATPSSLVWALLKSGANMNISTGCKCHLSVTESYFWVCFCLVGWFFFLFGVFLTDLAWGHSKPGNICFTSSHHMPSKISHFISMQGVPAPCPRTPCTWRWHQSPWQGLKALAPAWHCHTQTALPQWLRKQVMPFLSPSGFPCPLGWHCPPARNRGTNISPRSLTEALCLKAVSHLTDPEGLWLPVG